MSPTVRLDVVTAERLIFSDDVNVVIAPGVQGELGILPHHARLMTMLQPGELVIRKDDQEIPLAISGGFLEVRPDKIVVLADTAERAEEIDIARAEEARKRAEQIIKAHVAPPAEMAAAEAALTRSLTRLKVAERRRRRPGSV